MAAQMIFHELFGSNSMTAQIAFKWFLVALDMVSQLLFREELLLADLALELLPLFLLLVEFHVTWVGSCCIRFVADIAGLSVLMSQLMVF
jgi:hypothetical protein